MSRSMRAMSILLCAAMAPAGHGAYEVGQRWVYQHSGPKPGSFEGEPIDGRRIAQVIRHDPNDGCWIIEERYTKSSDPAGRLRVDPNRMVVAIEVDSKDGPPGLLRYDPPVPYEAPELAVGQSVTIETTLHMDSPAFSMPMRLEIERLGDETIATDAGTFEACRRYRTTTSATLDLKIAKVPFSEERHRWFHHSANGLVKETYRREPVKFLTWSRPAYEASSVLTAFGIEAVAERPLPDHPARDHDHDEHAGSALIPLALVAVAAAVAGVLLVRRRSVKSAAR
jgi:hypothetical protein